MDIKNYRSIGCSCPHDLLRRGSCDKTPSSTDNMSSALIRYTVHANLAKTMAVVAGQLVATWVLAP